LGHSENDAHEIKSQPFFKGINWEMIQQKTIAPPFKPRLLNEQDLRYFDKVFFRIFRICSDGFFLKLAIHQ